MENLFKQTILTKMVTKSDQVLTSLLTRNLLCFADYERRHSPTVNILHFLNIVPLK